MILPIVTYSKRREKSADSDMTIITFNYKERYNQEGKERGGEEKGGEEKGGERREGSILRFHFFLILFYTVF